MIRFFKKFFNLQGNDPENEINSTEKYSISSSWQYKKMQKLCLENKAFVINDFIYENLNGDQVFINGCLQQSIVDGDLVLFNALFFKKRQFSLVHSVNSEEILSYINQAFKYDKPDIFQQLVNSYSSQNSDSKSYGSEWQIQNLIEKIIESNKIQYLQILESSKLINFHKYIEKIIGNISDTHKVNEKDLNKISFILDYFPNKVDKDKLFLYACYGGEGRWPNKEVIQFLVKRNADIYTERGQGLIYAGQAKAIDVVEYLLKEDSYRFPSNPFSPVETKYNGKLSHIASICAQVNYNTDVIKCFLEYGAYIDVVRYNINQEMYPWLEKYGDTKKLFDELNSELKESQSNNQESKPKKLKV
jgi:hypothetical protein